MSAYESLEIPCPCCGAEHHPEDWFDREPRGSCPSCGATQEQVQAAAKEVLGA